MFTSSIVDKFFRDLRPSVPAAIKERLLAVVFFPERTISLAQSVDAPVGRLDSPLRVLEQHSLDLPHIGVGQTPIVTSHDAYIDDRVASDPSREIDVRVAVAEGERARGGKNGPASVKSGVARSGN